MMNINGCVFFFLLSMYFEAAPAVDCIVFSYNRPMQLYAFLESAEKYLSGISSKTVILRCDNNFHHAYSIVKEAFPNVLFMTQHPPYSDFKQLTMQALDRISSGYVFFAVDDDMVTEFADLNVCSQMLEVSAAYGFFLRLGLNIVSNYQTSAKYDLPSLESLNGRVLQWNLDDKNTNLGYWIYPHNVDMTVYRCADVKSGFQELDFKNPNTLEAGWVGAANNIIHRKGLCFSKSIMVNIPVNCVQTNWSVPFMHSWTVNQLLSFFESGLKIDINPLFGFQNPSCHFDYQLVFATR